MALFEFPALRKEPEIIFLDDDIVVAEKPAGMHTAPIFCDDSTRPESNLLSWVSDRYPEVGEVEGRGRGEGGLLHRLDRDTSGLVLFARDQPAFLSLSEAAAQGGFRKEYVLRAVSSGLGLEGCRPERVSPEGVPSEEWEALVSLGADGAEHAADLISDAHSSGTNVEVKGYFRAYGPGAVRVACALPSANLGRKKREWGNVLYSTSFLEARFVELDSSLEFRVALTRGFRHQIRAHLAWIGFPLLGDVAYGGKTSDRLYLHAVSIAFPHPTTGKTVLLER